MIPIPPATKTYSALVSSGQQERALRLLDLDLVADLELGERLLEGAVAEPGREPDDARLGRRGDERDVPPQTFLVVVPAVRQLDPEVGAGPVVGIVLDGEEDEQRSLRDLALLGNGRLPASRLGTRPATVSWFSACWIRCSSCQRSAVDSPLSTFSSSAFAASSCSFARASSISFTSTASSTRAIALSSSTLKKPGPVANSSTSSVARSR